jgi:hypothetical protein
VKRWTHLHSHISGGLIMAAAIEYRIWLLFALFFLAGIAFEWTRRTLATLADHWLWKRKRHASASKGVATQTERIPF